MHPEMKIQPEVQNPKPAPRVLRIDAEHLSMAAPPETPTRPKQHAGIPKYPPPGFGNDTPKQQEYPILASVVPTLHEDKRHLAETHCHRQEHDDGPNWSEGRSDINR